MAKKTNIFLFILCVLDIDVKKQFMAFEVPITKLLIINLSDGRFKSNRVGRNC